MTTTMTTTIAQEDALRPCGCPVPEQGGLGNATFQDSGLLESPELMERTIAPSRAQALPQRSCLKQKTTTTTSTLAATRNAMFKPDEKLVTCMICGSPQAAKGVYNKERHLAFKKRGREVHRARKKLNRLEAVVWPPPPQRRMKDFLSFWMKDNNVEKNLLLAKRRRGELEDQAVRNGWVDFAMFVGKSDSSKFRNKLKRLVRILDLTPVGAYRGSERLYATWGGVKVDVEREV